MAEQQTSQVLDSINKIEEAYEFMLAYAAQGRQQEAETEGASQIRGFLQRFRDALDQLSAQTTGLLPAGSPGAAYAEHFSADTKTVTAIIDLLLSRENITSDMIDNTNGMIAVRSFLTDLFFIDQVIIKGS